ncbi:hypothetical protein BGZ61DRAFT_511832 [Ilyonectria robusta]|uniref:uncharacterized protein n=1 Tax=Ilyonectria robusta TaxID=1079257 RepID=UPI001E8DCF76|nr:uncharacterized protein BGZ61DRAFT_511832 [Ilyonectria robusta]KAH8737170.1 hypothetical protein BGZ61DRAFT_511832 [Ilyonectria robusta]
MPGTCLILFRHADLRSFYTHYRVGRAAGAGAVTAAEQGSITLRAAIPHHGLLHLPWGACAMRVGKSLGYVRKKTPHLLTSRHTCRSTSSREKAISPLDLRPTRSGGSIAISIAIVIIRKLVLNAASVSLSLSVKNGPCKQIEGASSTGPSHPRVPSNDPSIPSPSPSPSPGDDPGSHPSSAPMSRLSALGRPRLGSRRALVVSRNLVVCFVPDARQKQALAVLSRCSGSSGIPSRHSRLRGRASRTKCVDWSDTPLTRTHTSKQLAVSQSRSLAHAHRRQLTGSSPHHLISPHLISPDRPSQFAERMYRAQIGLDFFATDYDLFVNLPLQPTTAQLLLQQGCNQ